MIRTTQQQNGQAATLTSLITNNGAQSPAWFGPVREQALGRFNELGLPDTHHEDWRFTNIKPIRDTRFELSQSHTEMAPDQADALKIPGLGGSRLVFVNGRFSKGLSDLKPLPKGVLVASLADVLESKQGLIEPHLGKLAGFKDNPFTALNTALAGDGVVVHVPQGQAVREPIYVLYITTGDKPLLVNPRNLMIAQQGAAVTVIEDYVALNEGVYLTNAVTEVVVEDNAEVTHYRLQRESAKAFHVSSLHVLQGRDSRFTSHSALLGAAITRNNVTPVLNGEGCDSLLNGLYIVGDQQIMDNHMRVVHAQPHCDSRQYYKGIMSDQSKGVFRGRIVVHQKAQKTDAVQSNQSLLLSPEASMNSDPQLEIYADDVKCTHGATIGQMDEDQAFYLQSRGIPSDTARAMIIYAFASEVIERMSCEPIRRFLQPRLLDRLPAGRVLEKSLECV